MTVNNDRYMKNDFNIVRESHIGLDDCEGGMRWPLTPELGSMLVGVGTETGRHAGRGRMRWPLAHELDDMLTGVGTGTRNGSGRVLL